MTDVNACRDLRELAPEVELVVLFGSTVTGRTHKHSDIDVAVFGILAPRIGGDRLDLVDLRRAGPLLSMNVARTGRVLYERDPGAWRRFQSLASRRYCDTEKLRRAQKRAIQVFLEQHGLVP
jgi:predicted nucleotidyltransferase